MVATLAFHHHEFHVAAQQTLTSGGRSEGGKGVVADAAPDLGLPVVYHGGQPTLENRPSGGLIAGHLLAIQQRVR